MNIRQLIEDLQDLEDNMKRLEIPLNADVVITVPGNQPPLIVLITGTMYDQKTNKIVLV